MVDLEEIQNYMRAQAVDAWLVYDFRGSNPIMWQLLGAKRRTTRRAFLLIPVAARPRLLCHAIEVDVFANLGVDIQQYRSWNEMCTLLQTALQDCGQVAMEYSPGAELPSMSWVDGGTLELVRSFGVQVVSSAALFQVGLTTWSAQALQSHRSACRQVVEVKDAAFDLVRSHLQGGAELSEFELQEFIVGEFARRQLDMDHRPIVGVNANSGNAHYEPTAAVCAPIVVGDWLLVDLWARHPGEENIFGDITWVGYVGAAVPSDKQAVFNIVKEGRDLVVARLQEAWERGDVLQGWQLDRLCRDHITAVGYGDYFVHRTGHSLGPGPMVHGLGVNLDDLETHDTREILPGTGFTIEPGIYLAEFGVRLEINVYIDPEDGPIVTTPIQDEVVLFNEN
jgi:Xaa-Pro aminopeptidase